MGPSWAYATKTRATGTGMYKSQAIMYPFDRPAKIIFFCSEKQYDVIVIFLSAAVFLK